MENEYTTPTVRSLGSVTDMTQQGLDKVGSSADIFTPAIPALDGVIQPDP